MTNTVGRPSIGADEAITLSLWDSALEIVTAGAALQAIALGGKSPSRAAWLRELFMSTFSTNRPDDLLSSTTYRRDWPLERINQSAPHRVTLKITGQHRIYLRQWECYVQSLDWTIPLYRNEAANLLICLEGPLFNRSLALKKKPSD